MITIQSPTAVLVDDVNFGAVADCIANNPHLAAGIQRALIVYDATLQARATAAEDTLADYKAVAEGALTAAKGVIGDDDLSDEETYAQLTAIIGEVEKPVRQRAIEAAEQEAAVASAKLAALRAQLVSRTDDDRSAS